MCLIVFAWKAHPDYRLIVAANRDELHRRPTQELHWWADQPDILAGRDLQAGGSWLAINRNGRFATVTNYRENHGDRQHLKTARKSRGALVTAFVAGHMPAVTYTKSFDGSDYAGVSVLAADEHELCYVSNRGDPARPLAAGVYGLSNASLDTPWPKLVRSRRGLEAMIANGNVNESALLRLLGDRTPVPAAEVDATELPFEIARAQTAPFIVSAEYGTRCSTVLMCSTDGQVSVHEQRFDAGGKQNGESRIEFRCVTDQEQSRQALTD